MMLEVAVGHRSESGPRAQNEDFAAWTTPLAPERTRKGILLAASDGVSGHAGGRDAAEHAVRGLIADYYATPDTWEVGRALERVLQAINQWVLAQARARPDKLGMACTLTALVLRGRRYWVAHAGDTRCYLRRGGRLAQLTADHVWRRPEMDHVLTRAIGLDPRLALDVTEGELEPGDVWILATDGAWAPLGRYEIERLADAVAARELTPQQAADQGVRRALEAGGQDNATLLVARVDALPAAALHDTRAASGPLAPLPRLAPGQEIDGFRVEETLHTSRVTLLYRVRDLETGRSLVLKTLTPEAAADARERSAFAYEEWLARRLNARYFAQVPALDALRRSALYYVQSYHPGHTLAELLRADHHWTAGELVPLAIRLAHATGALHRRGVIHRDLKPENLHLGDDGELRILDLGVAISGADPPERAREMAGTPSYLAPEQFDGAPASTQSDLYALGVTLYHLATRRFPYGEIEPFQHPRFGDPVLPSRYRPDLPEWLENVLLKAVARDPKARFETAEELLLALEGGPERAPRRPAPTPLIERHGRVFWPAVAAASVALNLLLIWALFARGG
jgi:serine/threonine protein phosphatase PrpC